MAAAPPIDSCVQCASKYKRTRVSLCRCNHCSVSFCFDCMKEHHEDLQEKITHLSHQYNEVHELYQTKQQMIETEVKNARCEVDEWFNQIIEAKKKIMDNIEQAEKHGQDHLSEILTKLQQISIKINGLTKETLFDLTQIPSLLTDLDHIQNDLKNIVGNKKAKLPEVTFNYEINFESTSVPTTDVTQKDPSPATETSQSCSIEKVKSSNQYVVLDENDEACQAETSEDSAPECLLPTSFPIDRMASDGINIMYSTYDTTPPMIAYCDLKNLQVGDRYRHWHQLPIVDMIYWKSIEKFICARMERSIQ
ncbi:hypothetical protein I4U23_022263 [Adineta vaga]|nr:hypothetical protein I4U23_022263 [Adineta vaga]